MAYNHEQLASALWAIMSSGGGGGVLNYLKHDNELLQ